MDPRIDHWAVSPELMKGLMGFNIKVERNGLEASLRHLVKLRASQINGCAFCVELHGREARGEGESTERLALLSVWRESYLFTPRERAALAWTEAVTTLDRDRPDDELFKRVRGEFSEEELVTLTALIAVINAWNRLAVAFGAVHAPPQEEAA